MDIKLVERLYNRRFWFSIGMTIGIVTYFGIEAAQPYYAGMPAEKILEPLKFAGLAIGMLFVIIQGRDDRALKRDPQLKEALNDEMMQLYRLKASRLGLACAMISAFLIGGLPGVAEMELPVKSACFIVLTAALLGTVIPLWVYMRR